MRARLRAGVLVAIGLALWAGPVAAQAPIQTAFAIATTNVTLTTTTENVAVSSGPALVTKEMVNVCVHAWAQLTTGTMTTTVTPRIRRGTAVAGTLVGEATALTVQAAAGSNEQYHMMACEDRRGVATAEYSFTLQQAGADGNGTVLQAGIFVFVR